ncbi:MAG: Wzz/FepE/Etk N-terminal domain-containing protein [Clostridiales bacterium]|nr:Wzz/FepE/Etk N-terminal domain-containing protein [Clostridiales bacterium]
MEKQEQREDVVEIDLKELFLELLNHWLQIVVAIVLMAAIFFTYSRFLVTPQYSSTSILYVLSKSTSITSLTDIQIGTNLTNDYTQVVTGRPVLDQVIDNLGLDMDYSELSSKVTLNNPSDSRMLEITVEDPDPQEAKTIADEIAAVAADYISEKMDQDPPQIIQYGYVADSPSSPDITRNTAIGGLLGAVLAIVIITITYLMNDTIMTPEDMERKVGLQVLGSLPLDETEFDGGKTKKTARKPKQKKSAKGGAKNGK